MTNVELKLLHALADILTEMRSDVVNSYLTREAKYINELFDALDAAQNAVRDESGWG